jgi:hypothetical protein
MFIAALFTIANLWKHPRFPPTNKRIKKMYLYTMEFYPATKKNEILSFADKWVKLENEILSFADKWVKLENIMLGEVSQVQKGKNHMFSFICKLQT